MTSCLYIILVDRDWDLAGAPLDDLCDQYVIANFSNDFRNTILRVIPLIEGR